MSLLQQWILAGTIPPDADIQVQTMLNTREDLAQGILNVATFAIGMSQKVQALTAAVEALQTLAGVPVTV